MLLQRQYSLWKTINVLIGIVIGLLIIAGVYFKWECNSFDKQINQEILKKNKIDEQVHKLQADPLYEKYILAKMINKKFNNTNYGGLYEYLRQIRDEIKKTLVKGFSLTEFDLTINRGKVDIGIVLPNYNILYSGNNNLIDKLLSQDFVKEMSINSFKKSKSAIFTRILINTAK